MPETKSSEQKELSFSITTQNVKVTAVPRFVEEKSVPSDDYFAWSYNITIENKGEQRIHLLSSYVEIINDMGQVQHIDSPGVIGMQPIIEEGKDFKYTSGIHLNAPSGMLLGRYKAARQDGTIIEIAIPAFSLDCPYAHQKVN